MPPEIKIVVDTIAVVASSLLFLTFMWGYFRVLPQAQLATITAWVSSLGTELLRRRRPHAVLYWLLPVFFFFVFHPLSGVILFFTTLLGWFIDREYGHIL